MVSVLLVFRLNAQALTLAALAGAAVVEYYDREHESTVEKKYPNPFLQNHEKQQHKEMKE